MPRRLEWKRDPGTYPKPPIIVNSRPKIVAQYRMPGNPAFQAMTATSGPYFANDANNNIPITANILEDELAEAIKSGYLTPWCEVESSVIESVVKEMATHDIIVVCGPHMCGKSSRVSPPPPFFFSFSFSLFLSSSLIGFPLQIPYFNAAIVEYLEKQKYDERETLRPLTDKFLITGNIASTRASLHAHLKKVRAGDIFTA